MQVEEAREKKDEQQLACLDGDMNRGILAYGVTRRDDVLLCVWESLLMRLDTPKKKVCIVCR